MPRHIFLSVLLCFDDLGKMQGDCVITVQLTEEDELEDDVDFYLVFTGSTVQHCTSTRKINPGTLETIAPGHDCCETVKVTLCASRKGLHHLVVAEGSFQFIQDEAYDAAQFLATCAGNQQALNFTRFLDRSRPPSGDVNFLDERVVLAFRHLKLPAEWNVLGTDQSLNESSPRETLMHFAVRLGLLRLTWFLLQQPGGRGALCIHNNEGATPVSLALERGYKTLHQLLTAEEAGEPDSWSTLSHVVHSGDYCVKYHRGLNVYTLTAEAKEGAKASMESDVEQLQKYIEKGPSALVNADVSQLSAPTCHEENKFESGSLESLNNTSKDLLSLAGTENPGCSCESKNTATLSKKEEEGPATVVDSRTLSDKNDCMLSRDTEADGAASFPSCGNTNEETGMTSTGVVLNQASLCSRDNTQQEAQIVEERATESAVTVAETAGKIPTPQEGVDVAMGQAECKNCTGTGDAASVRQSVENRGDETSRSRTASLNEVHVPSVELIRSAEPLLGDFGDAACKGGGCADAQGMQAQDSTNVRVDTGDVPAGCGETRSSKESGTDPKTENAEVGLPESVVQSEPPVKEKQRATVGAGKELLIVTEIKSSEPLLKHDPVVLEVNNNGNSGGQVDDGNAGGGLNGLDSGDNVPNHSKNNHFDRPGQSDEESVCCPASSKIPAVVVEGEGDPEALSKMPLETETAGRGSTGSADGAGGSAAPCHSGNQAVLKDEMCDSLNLDTASAGEPEPVSLDAGLCSAEKENRLVTSESMSEQKEALKQGDLQQGQGVDQERGPALAPSGQEASLHSKDSGFSSWSTGTECVQDNLMDTPSAVHNKESEHHQEVAAAATEMAVLAEQDSSVHSKAEAETSLPADCGEKEDFEKHSLLQPAGKGKAECSQELCESGTLGKEKDLSEEPAVVKSSVCSQGEEPAEKDSTADTELKEEISCQEADDNATVGAEEGIVPGSESEHKLLDAKNAPPPDPLLNQDHDLGQGGSTQSDAPELKAVFVMGASSVAFESKEPLSVPETSTVTSDLEEMDDVLSRALLQPIAEEPPCARDSNADAVCLAGAREQSYAMSEASLSQLQPCKTNAATEPSVDVGAKNSVPEADGFWLDEVASRVKSPDAFVSMLETPSVPESAAEKLENILVGVFPSSPPHTGTVPGAILNGEMDLSLQFGEPVKTGDAKCENFLEDGLSGGCASSQAVLKRESGSESELFPLAGDGMDDIIFGKHEEEQFACDVTSSSSSADDTVSLERNSSLGSDISLPHALNLNRPKERHGLDGSCINMAVAEGQESELGGSGEMEEELDSITEVPTHSSVLRNSMRPLSPFRRHSWGPGKNAANEAEINHRSSMRVLGDGIRKPPIHRRSYSLEGLAGDSDDNKKPSSNLETSSLSSRDLRRSPLTSDERGSLVSLTEEEVESEQGEMRGFEQQACQRSQPHGFNFCASAASPLTKSISLMTIIQPGLDSDVSEESSNFLPPSPSRKDLEGKSGTKVSRTFSYIKNKMSSSKKSKEKEKDKEKTKEKDKDSKEKEKDKKLLNGHLFSPTPTVGPVICYHCLNPFNKDSYLCANCNAIVHKGCKESLTSCAKVKMKFGWGFLSDVSLLASQPKERPRSAILAPDENTATSLFNNRRSQQNTALSKSVSIQNIAGVGNDENIIHTWKFLSQSTDSLHKISRVNESMESLTDEGADMNEGQLMGDFELDSKQLEAESWSQAVDKKFLQQQKKDVVKRQDVIYELMQTEMHHVRTLKIMSDVYSRGMMQELQFDQQMVEKVFPCLDDLLNIHNQFFQRILERKKESLRDKSEKNYVIKRIGDILVNQFSGENGERMKKTYGKFCGHHNEAVNYFKDLQAKEKRFQAFIKKKMSSTVVRRLGIPECILLVTQRITKYPVLLQTILQYTKENEVEHQDLTQSLNLVKDVIAAVNSKVSNYEKKTRLCEIYTRTDSKSIMRMKSGQMFAREDLRRRKLIRDGPVSLRNAAGRLKEVQAVLLSDMLIFLQEKDQKYVFASLDQKSTVISLKKLIVREVAHEEKGLFLITTVVKDPEMVEVHASSKEERNSWIQIIQDTINTMDKDEDEGIPSESELEKRVVDTKVRELKEQLQQKDQQIITLLEEKEKIFQDLTDCSMPEDGSVSRVLFRSNTEEAQKGEDIMKSAINEVEYLQSVISRNLGSALGAADLLPTSEQEGGVGPVFLPRRAETFGGFDSHQMNASKCGEKDEGDDTQDLRRTESDSILKKVPLLFFDCAFSEGRHCADFILASPQAVVLQQDTYIEDQKLVLSERALTRSSSRPNSLIEQEKQRSLEKQRQELANLQKQQAQHQEEKRRREKEWEAREKELTEREGRLAQREELAQKGNHDLEKEREELRRRKVAYQQDLEHLRAAQKQLEREKEQLRRDLERLPPMQMEPDLRQVANPHDKIVRSPSRPIAEDSRQHDSSFPKQGHLNAEQSLAPKRNSLTRTHKEKGTFQLLSTTNQTNKAAEGQQATRLFSLTKTKDKKEKKKKGKGHRSQPADAHSSEAPPEGEEIFC
uniref:A-kinase anchoring protein 13 n=1 Tax=Pelusios castaneus TaxID=367368 RepID=A0A8C8R8T1_9SAUR